jgi:two-component system chemotaxis response regulator CheB
MAAIRVLIVDDSVVVRRLFSTALDSDPDIEVVGTAVNGKAGVQKVDQLKPDIVILDVEMPVMTGLEALREIRKTHRDLPILMFSTLTERGAETTLDALAAGATDYITKPVSSSGIEETHTRITSELIPKIKDLCSGAPSSPLALARRRHVDPPVARKKAPRAATPAAPPDGAVGKTRPAPRRRSDPQTLQRVDIVAIGISTGGPQALAEVIPHLPADFPVPIVIVQHMPEVFTRLLAERLDASSEINVREGTEGALLQPGEVWIAPGGRHMVIKGKPERPRLSLNQDPPENSCRPAVDVLFRSVPEVYGSRVLALVMTGMGRDGADGAELIRTAGGQVVVQDKDSSVVWGMPGAVIDAGTTDRMLDLKDIAGELIQRTQFGRLGTRTAGEPGAQSTKAVDSNAN